MRKEDAQYHKNVEKSRGLAKDIMKDLKTFSPEANLMKRFKK